MYIEELHLQNFRGFKELTLKFPRNLAVIIGVNGSGKSSILDAIALFLSLYTTQLTQKSPLTISRFLSEDDIHKEADESYNSIQVSIFDNRKISWSILKNRESSEGEFKDQQLLEYTNYIVWALEQNPSLHLPLCIYYKTHRMVLTSEPKLVRNSSTESRQRKPNQLNAYKGAFSSKIIDFQDFFEWFRDEEDYENEIRLREDTNYRNKNLEVVRIAITKFLNNFPKTHFSNLHVVRAIPDREFGMRRVTPTLTIEKNGQSFKLEKLSDGEKMLLMVITDLARRLAILNPSVDEPAKVLERQGIVLIDEVDLHLHPQWQRIVIPALTNTFPNCQFIVTTHSPQVLSRVHKENVIILEDSELVEVTPHTFGKDSNSILYELMGVTERPLEVQKQLDECFHLIDDNKIEEAKIKLQKLTELLGENDPELVRAYTLIDFFNPGE